MSQLYTRKTRISWIAVLLPAAPFLAAGPAASLFSLQPSAVEVSNAKLFEEPLVALGTPAPGEAQALAMALDAYMAGGKLEDTTPVQAFLKAYPGSAWELSLLVNVGLVHRHTGGTAAALQAWEAAWEAGKGRKDPLGTALANRALGELLEANAGLGRMAQLEALIKETEGRPLAGLVTEKISGARESLTYMKLSPETAFRCGPMALAYLKATQDPLIFGNPAIHRMLSSARGTSLSMNAKWASQVGLALQMAKREPSAALPVPSVLHLRTGHFAAVMFAKNGRYLIQDPFLGDAWISLATIDQEGSGYALVPAGPLPAGWTPVPSAEGDGVWGKGAWGPGRPDDTRPDSVKIPSTLTSVPQLTAIARPAYHADLVSLNLDVPIVDYTPVRGPRVDFTVTYNQREYGQPQVFDYCNLGPKWTFSFLACIKDDSTNPDADVTVCNPGGGGQVFHTRGDGVFLPENSTQAQLSHLPGNGYLIQYPSGRKEFYDLADRAWGLRRVVLTRIQDRIGNEVKLTWDPMLRIVAVTDATGKATTIGYEASDPLKIAKVTDPFGRATRFQYDVAGRLTSVVDPQGHATTFAYGPSPESPGQVLDFLRSMMGPGGSYSFRAGETLVGPSYRRWIEAMGPNHDLERLESGAGYAYEIPPEKLPLVPELDSAYHPLAFRFRESFFWPAGTFDPRKPDFKKARHIRWGHGPGAFSSGIILSEKAADGPRHWYVHTGDFWDGVFHAARTPSFPLNLNGALKPGARVLGVLGTEANKDCLAPVFDGNRALVTRDYWLDKSKQVVGWFRNYDPDGRLLGETGPLGEKSEYTWDPANGNLLRVAFSGKTPGHRFSFDGSHRLLAWKREGKPALNLVYGADGTFKSWREGKGAPWSLRFDLQGRLLAARHSGRQWTFAWDSFGRIQSVTDPKGAVRRVETDPLDQSSQTAQPNPSLPIWLAQDTLGIGKPMPVPPGCGSTFASLLAGANGPLIQRLLAQP